MNVRSLCMWVAFAMVTSIVFAQNVETSPVVKKAINPLDYGLRDAQTGKERYDVLMAAHSDAVFFSRPLSYSGIDTIDLEIPDSAVSLPLPYNTDFANVVINIRNDSPRDITLFTLSGDDKAKPLAATKQQIDNGDFSAFDQLRNGDYLVIVRDSKIWTTRIGYGYPCYRSDLLYVHDGKAVNQTAAPYSDPASEPSCSFVPVNNKLKTVENVSIRRVRGSKSKTYCFSVSNQNNVLIKNVYIYTPKGKFIADRAISLSNCSNCRVEDVRVDSTYSVPGSYGYAFSMGTVWNTTFVRCVADAAWGVFGSNNVNSTTLRECDLNRFDIHCYGRDVLCVGCIFRGKQTQFSSMYGTVEFDSCHFADCLPVRIRSSYNAYTPFDIKIRHCVMDLTMKHHSLVNVMLLATERNERPELSARCWPNVYIEDLTINMPFLTRRIFLIDPTGTTSECKKPVEYMNHIKIDGLRTVRNGKPVRSELYLSSRKFFTAESLKVELNDVDLLSGRVVNLIND